MSDEVEAENDALGLGGVDPVAILKCGEDTAAATRRDGEDIGCQVGISVSAEGSCILVVKVEVRDVGSEDFSP